MLNFAKYVNILSFNNLYSLSPLSNLLTYSCDERCLPLASSLFRMEYSFLFPNLGRESS